MSLNARWQFGDTLLLISNNRISSFCCIRGSKHCFLTSFSHLNCYFLFLVFLHNRYLLVSLRHSCCMGIQFLAPFSHTSGTPKYYAVCAPPYSWDISCIFLKQDACGNLVLELVSVFFPRSTFCQRFLMQTSVGQSQIMPFLLTQNP
jgi:hypothetical protein